MASTPEGRRLTEEHRQAQQDVRDDFLTEFLALWALLDTQRLDETGPGWVRAVMRAVAAYRLLSAETATRYFWEFDAVESPDSTTRPRIPGGVEDITSRPDTVPPPAGPRTGRPPRQQRAPRSRQERNRRAERELDRAIERSGIRWDFDEGTLARPDRRVTIEIPEIDWEERDRAVEISLNVTGPIGQKSKIGRGKPLELVRNESFVEAAGAASRHVLDGGNRSALRLIEDNARLIGYIRVTDGDPCYFCAMLASRGPVYRTPKRAGSNVRGTRNPSGRAGEAFTGAGAWKVHDNCACTVEPVYTTDTGWPGRGREFQQLWNDHIRNRYSGEEAVRQWRRLYTQLQREQRRVA